jgi:hypothetical protein
LLLSVDDLQSYAATPFIAGGIGGTRNSHVISSKSTAAPAKFKENNVMLFSFASGLSMQVLITKP